VLIDVLKHKIYIKILNYFKTSYFWRKKWNWERDNIIHI